MKRTNIKSSSSKFATVFAHAAGTCFGHLFRAPVSGTCFGHLFRAPVSGTCFGRSGKGRHFCICELVQHYVFFSHIDKSGLTERSTPHVLHRALDGLAVAKREIYRLVKTEAGLVLKTHLVYDIIINQILFGELRKRTTSCNKERFYTAEEISVK